MEDNPLDELTVFLFQAFLTLGSILGQPPSPSLYLMDHRYKQAHIHTYTFRADLSLGSSHTGTCNSGLTDMQTHIASHIRTLHACWCLHISTCIGICAFLTTWHPTLWENGGPRDHPLQDLLFQIVGVASPEFNSPNSCSWLQTRIAILHNTPPQRGGTPLVPQISLISASFLGTTLL